MKPGRYAAADGSFGRSAGAAMGRGVLLLGIALLIGIVLLNATDDQPPGTDVAAGTSSRGDNRGDDNNNTPPASTTTTTTTQPAKTPQEVKVLVANGSSVKGAAKTANDKLKAAQYNALSPTDGPSTNDTAAYYTAGFEREAAAVAALLEFPTSVLKPMPTPPPMDAKTANVLVLLGTDHASRFATATATTTTAAGGTTTTTARAGGTTTTTAKP